MAKIVKIDYSKLDKEQLETLADFLGDIDMKKESKEVLTYSKTVVVDDIEDILIDKDRD